MMQLRNCRIFLETPEIERKIMSEPSSVRLGDWVEKFP